MHSMKAKNKIANIIQTIFLAVLGIIVLLPIYIAIANAFKQSDIILSKPLSIPMPPILKMY